MHWSDWFGWLGFGIVTVSYAMVAARRWRVRSMVYQLGNLIGSLGIAINSTVYAAWVPALLNYAWAVIAAATLLQLRQPCSANDTQP